MKKIWKILPRSLDREANASEDCDNSTRVRGSTYSASTSTERQAKEESGPWGLKELWSGTDPVLDIVAVHGLNGHRERTWTCDNRTGGDGVMWLRDLLPKRIPRARVWTWGYDSRTHTRSHRDHLTVKTLYDHGRELVFDLDGARRECGTHQRPIIFVAHSLGGIVVKNALLHSDRIKEGNLEEQRSIKLSTYGIIFMGTPHQGGQGVSMGKILLNVAKMQGDASDSLLKLLEEHSELLQQQMSEFSLISQSFDIKFAYETKPTPLAGLIAKVIVPKWSAVVSGTPDAAEFGINADHRNMTKFSNLENEDFIKLSRTLELMLQKSGKKQAISPKVSKKTFTVPFERDSKFVGREDIIAELDERLNGQRRVALAGIGGIGKSQIAIEYCYRFRDRHPNASVFWVHVGTISRFKQAYEAMATNLGLVEKDDPKANTIQLVTDWLNNAESGNWLMVLDNADDQAVFKSRFQVTEASEQSMPLFCYLPHSQKGSIVITTRDQRVGQRLAAKPVIVGSFDGPMAKTLLQSKLDQSIEWIEEDANKLVTDLDFLPLAVTQAAAFISENNITVKKYTNLLRTSDSGLTSLLNQDLIDLRRDFDASSSIVRTWQVSFDQIRMQNTRAAELLSLMAVLDRQSIPKALLCRHDEQEVEIVIALGTLQAFSLISSDREGEAFEMHRLVQVSTLKWLEMQSEKLKWQEGALRLLSANFPNGTFETWETCALYLPHVIIVIGSLTLGLDHLNELRLLENTADYLQFQGQFKVAEQIIVRALELYQKAYGNEHSDTLRSMKILGEILTDAGKYDDAEKLLRKVLMSGESTLGEKHEFTLSTISSLTSVLMSQGKDTEAKELLEQNVKLQSEILGEENPKTLLSMGNLALTYQHLKRLNEAEELELQVLKAHEKALGAEHPHTLWSMASLAMTYADLNRLNEAAELEVQVLKARKKVLGAEHRDTLWSMTSLALTYVNLNRWNEAEDLEVQALKGREKALGAEHRDTLFSMAELAATYQHLNRWNEAEDLGLKALKAREKALGAEDPDTVFSMADLAVTYKALNRLNEAEELEVQVLKAREKALGAEHPDTLLSMASLAWTWKRQHRLENAIPLMSDAVRLSENILGVDNPDFKDRQRWLNTWLRSEMKEVESSQNAGSIYRWAAEMISNISRSYVASLSHPFSYLPSKTALSPTLTGFPTETRQGKGDSSFSRGPWSSVNG